MQKQVNSNPLTRLVFTYLSSQCAFCFVCVSAWLLQSRDYICLPYGDSDSLLADPYPISVLSRCLNCLQYLDCFCLSLFHVL